MDVKLERLAFGQVSRLINLYQEERKLPFGIKITYDQIVNHAIDELHKKEFGQSGPPGTAASAESLGVSDEMQYAVQEEKSSGFVTLSLHDSASDAQAAWDKEFGFNGRAQGRIVEVPPYETALAGAADTRAAPKVVTRLGYER